MKADNELAILLAYRYILSLSKTENMFKKKTKQKKMTKQQESNPRPLTCKGNAMSIESRQLMLIVVAKLIIFKSFCSRNSDS